MKKKTYQMIGIAVLSICLLTGCGNKEKEEKASLREAGITCMNEGKYDQAVELFDLALAQEIGGVDKDDLDICYYKADALCAEGSIWEAIAVYDAILAFDEKEGNAYYLRGSLYAKELEVELAKADFSKAIACQPDNFELYMCIYEHLAPIDAVAAKEYLEQGYEKAVKEGATQEELGRMLLLFERYEEALETLKLAKENGSKTADFYLAKVYEELSCLEDVKNAYQSYLEENETDLAGLCAAGDLCLKMEDYQGAIAYYEKAISLPQSDRNQALSRNLIVAYEYNGDFDKAFIRMSNYVALYPEDEEAQKEYTFLTHRQMYKQE